MLPSLPFRIYHINCCEKVEANTRSACFVVPDYRIDFIPFCEVLIPKLRELAFDSF